MATIRLVPSTYSRSSTSRVTVTNPENMYYNTDHTDNYCSIRGRNSSSYTYYAFIGGFNFGDVPSNATVSSFTVKIRCYRNSYQGTGSTYRLRLASSASNNSVISDTTMSSDIGTTVDTYTIPTGGLTWSTLSGYGSNFCIEVPLHATSSQYPYVYVYGAEIEVTYSAETVHPTSVSVSPTTASIEVDSTVQLTETVLPANATDKSVTWSSSNTSIATVSSSGLVTGVSAGNATITVTTVDGSKTATCSITVTQPTYTEYTIANTMVPGKSYLVANGNSGSVYLMSNEANGSRTLKGVQVSVSNNKISITSSIENKCLFNCILTTTGNSITTTLESDGKYLYCDNASGLRFNTVTTLDRFWHFNNNKFWQFKSSSSDGYSDTSSEYKYYLQWDNSGNFTDNHVSTTSIEDSSLPEVYLFTEATVGSESLYYKDNGSWIEIMSAYKKINGSWVLQSDLSSVFNSNTNYIAG